MGNSSKTSKRVSIHTDNAVLKFIACRIFPLVFIGLGIGLIAYGVHHRIRAGESRHWPKVEGVIRESRIESQRLHETGSAEVRTIYQAQIRYEYLVGGKRYSGNRISYGVYNANDHAKVQRLVSRYPLNKRLAVYYHPENPADSVLETGSEGTLWPLLGFGAVLFVIGVILVLLMHRVAALPSDPETGPAPAGPPTLRPKISGTSAYRLTRYRWTYLILLIIFSPGIFLPLLNSPAFMGSGSLEGLGVEMGGILFASALLLVWLLKCFIDPPLIIHCDGFGIKIMGHQEVIPWTALKEIETTRVRQLLGENSELRKNFADAIRLRFDGSVRLTVKKARREDAYVERSGAFVFCVTHTPEKAEEVRKRLEHLKERYAS